MKFTTDIKKHSESETYKEDQLRLLWQLNHSDDIPDKDQVTETYQGTGWSDYGAKRK